MPFSMKKVHQEFPVATVVKLYPQFDRPTFGPVLWIVCAYLVVQLLLPSGLKAQSSYLEQIGASEVEVYYHVDPSEDGRKLRKEGDVLTVSSDGMKAKYVLLRGKVSEVHLDQHFDTETAAKEAFDEALQICREHGLGMQVVNSGSGRVLRGEGNGLRSSLVLTTIQAGYRFEAQIVAMR
jgi:hypothetical protein